MKVLLQIFAIAMCTVTVCAVLRRFSSEFVLPVLIAGCAIIAYMALEPLSDAVGGISSLASASGFGGYFTALLKALGCAFTAQTAADICRDTGESALASKIELAGRVELLLIALPLATEVVETAHTLAGV